MTKYVNKGNVSSLNTSNLDEIVMIKTLKHLKCLKDFKNAAEYDEHLMLYYKDRYDIDISNFEKRKESLREEIAHVEMEIENYELGR